MGTFGTGPFDNDGALDLLDELASQPADQRRELLERIFFRVQDRPDLLGWKFFPDEVVAAAAVVAASLHGGEGVRQMLADRGYDAGTILLPTADPEQSASAREALLLAAGRDSPWHASWSDPETAAQAQQTTDQLVAIFFRAALPADRGDPAGRIEAGELEPNRPIPSETAIQQEFGVARETARKAMALLREQGLVVTVPGMGTYVRKR